MAKLGKALMSLLLDKKAREALDAKAAAKAATRHAPHPSAPSATQAPQRAEPAPTQEQINARLHEAQQAASGRVNTPDRRQLIQNAMKVRANKAKMLEDLPEEQRRKLQALAMMSFMKARPKG